MIEMVYRIRRHRKIGDRVAVEKHTYEIVGIHGQGNYGVVIVLDGKAGSLPGTMQLGLWVEDTTTKRPWPFG